jgi:ribonuclease P protein component
VAKIFTLNQNIDFRRVYNRGKSFVNPALVTYVTPNRAGYCRVGITTSKKIGKAVVRNRARRVIRAAYCEISNIIDGGYDIVFVARGKTPYRKSTEIAEIMKSHFAEAGIIEGLDNNEKDSD